MPNPCLPLRLRRPSPICLASRTAQAALQYGTAQGFAPLRDRLLARTTALDGVMPSDVSLAAEDVVITTGSQQFLYLASELLLDPGDIRHHRGTLVHFVYRGLSPASAPGP